MVIGDEPLTPAAVVAAARGGPIDVELSAAARERIARSRRTAERLAARQRVYGRTTGVGANRHVLVAEADLLAHSERLLRSHAGGVGDPLPDDVVRAALLIRLAQMAAGGGGHRPEVADALATVLRDGPLPVLRDLGGIGTGTSRCSPSWGWRWPARASGPAVLAPRSAARTRPARAACRRGSRSRPATRSRS